MESFTSDWQCLDVLRVLIGRSVAGEDATLIDGSCTIQAGQTETFARLWRSREYPYRSI
jgi:hypothetical protein